MADFDATANAQVDSGAFAPGQLIFIDFDGDPLRATTCGRDLTFSGTGDTDLDGHTFAAFDGQFVDVGDVGDSTDGSDTLTIALSGVQTIDDELLALIADKSKWQGRLVRLWDQIYDASGVTLQGATVPTYTGYASKVVVKPRPQGSTIELQVEKYLASMSQASNRTWLAQSLFDAADTSAQATLAAANMGRGSATSSSGGGSSGGGGGGRTNAITGNTGVVSV